MKNALLPLALLIFLSVTTSCATTGERNLRKFNKDYQSNNPVSPKYKVDKVGANRYQILVYQGEMLFSPPTTRFGFLRKAAFMVMETTCKDLNQKLYSFDFSDRKDITGYVNIIGFFECG